MTTPTATPTAPPTAVATAAFTTAPTAAPTAAPSGAPTAASWQRRLGFIGFAAACYTLGPYLGLTSFDVDPRIAELWPAGGIGFILLTTVWTLGRSAIAGTCVYLAVTFATTAVLLDHDLLAAVWMGLLAAGQSWLMTALYRQRLQHTGWAPESPHDVATLLFSALGSSLALGILGGFPHLGPTELPTMLLWWWVLRSTVFCFVGGVIFMVIFHGRRAGALPGTPRINQVALGATAVLCVYGSYHDPSLPLSWLLIIPSVWGGLTLSVRGTAYLALTVALASASMSYLPQNRFGYDALLPAASIMDLLVTASCAFTLILALMREQRATLIEELDRRSTQSESQRRMLETVFDTMSDGVVIVDDNQVSMYNAAARKLLGRPIPTGTPQSWTEEFGLAAAEGGAIDDEVLREALSTDAEHGPSREALEVQVRHDGTTRVVELSSQHLGTAEESSMMVLLHDVTAQRARLRDLSNFAGMVAHDLRGPLTVLNGWLEVVEDGDPAQEGPLVDVALRRARESSTRMQQVIEDWLTYAVVQNGQIRPEAVKLIDVSSEIVEARRACDGRLEPVFVLDLEHSVEADLGLIRQLLDNLVGNAIKYTAAEEQPWVRLRSMPDDELGWIRIEVTDQGVGIPTGQEERIFEEFHRGPEQGRTPGTGLGLALTRRIVALHGGQMRARRNPKGGSTFSFTLPEA